MLPQAAVLFALALALPAPVTAALHDVAQTVPSLASEPTGLVSGTNLLKNGNFEQGCSGWFTYYTVSSCNLVTPGASATGRAMRVNNLPVNNLWAQYVSSNAASPPVLVLDAQVKNLHGPGTRISAQGIWGVVDHDPNTGTGNTLFLLGVSDTATALLFDGVWSPLFPLPNDNQFHRLTVVMVNGAHDATTGVTVPNTALLLIDGAPAEVPGPVAGTLVPYVLTGQHGGFVAPHMVFFGDGGSDTRWGSSPDLVWDEMYLGPQLPATPALPALPALPRVP